MISKKIISISCFILAFAVAAYAVKVCPRCGYEVGESDANCTHCKAIIGPDSKEENTEVKSDTNKNDLNSVVTLEDLKKQVDAGKQQLAKKDNDVARLLFNNAIILSRLTATNMADELKALIEKCNLGSGVAKNKCPVCNGSGRVSSAADAGKCEKCSGAGTVLKTGTVDDRKYIAGQAKKRFADIEQAMSYEQIGQVWLPPNTAKKLDVKNIAALKKANPQPCPACMGLGLEDCKECKGTGYVKCSNTKCDNGIVTVEVGKLLADANIKRTEKCKTCGGSGRQVCLECSGKGSRVCKTCGGTGERPECKTCSGNGYLNCKKCSGSGNVKDVVCSLCGGKGISLCNACGGDGRK